jgi:hypothetical protein
MVLSIGAIRDLPTWWQGHTVIKFVCVFSFKFELLPCIRPAGGLATLVHGGLHFCKLHARLC